jgi:hypothetical protein
MQTSRYLRIYCATLSVSPLAKLGVAALFGMGLVGQALAQSSCSSDGQKAPTALVERFISAECDTCWAKGTLPNPSTGQAAVDWILPSPKGDDAALSAAATRDAQTRLQALGLPWDASKAGMQASAVQKLLAHGSVAATPKLRVAHGLPFNGYIGASIEFTPAPNVTNAPNARKPAGQSNGHDLFAHLVLIETLPAGAEGSDVERNLVRNVLTTPWRVAEELGKVNKEGFKAFFESRPISLPAGVNPERLRVLGWVQDAGGKVLATAQSRCAS